MVASVKFALWFLGWHGTILHHGVLEDIPLGVASEFRIENGRGGDCDARAQTWSGASPREQSSRPKVDFPEGSNHTPGKAGVNECPILAGLGLV